VGELTMLPPQESCPRLGCLGLAALCSPHRKSWRATDVECNVKPHSLVIQSLSTFAVYYVQYGIKKRESDATVSSLAPRDDGRKKLSSAGLSDDLQTNQGVCTVSFWLHHE